MISGGFFAFSGNRTSFAALSRFLEQIQPRLLNLSLF